MLFSYNILPPVAVAEAREKIMVNRWALLSEFYIHPLSQDALENYFTKIPLKKKKLLLTNGMKQYRVSQIAALMELCEEEIAPNVRNCFGERWPALAFIHPENANVIDA